MIIRPASRRLALVAMAAVAAGPGVALASRDVALAARGAGSPVTIGLFVPLRGPQAALGREVLRGAEIAVAQARREDGARGRPLRLVTAPSDLRWEASTGALVRLLYEEGAVAVVGALDGRSAHLAEQVITRSRGRAVFVTPWASESTLTRIRIPWFFSVVPDDHRQAAALAGEIFSGRRAGRAAAWVEEAFDCRAAAQAFVEAAPPGTVVRFSAGDPNGREDLAARIRRGEFGALVLFASPLGAADLSSWLQR
ncbi:MAG: ABC transporter substrate-binding protein, partial [Acidobacteriota bacterium]